MPGISSTHRCRCSPALSVRLRPTQRSVYRCGCTLSPVLGGVSALTASCNFCMQGRSLSQSCSQRAPVLVLTACRLLHTTLLEPQSTTGGGVTETSDRGGHVPSPACGSGCPKIRVGKPLKDEHELVMSCAPHDLSSLTTIVPHRKHRRLLGLGADKISGGGYREAGLDSGHKGVGRSVAACVLLSRPCSPRASLHASGPAGHGALSFC